MASVQFSGLAQHGFKVLDLAKYSTSTKLPGVFNLIVDYGFPSPPTGQRWKTSTDTNHPASDGWFSAPSGTQTVYWNMNSNISETV